MYSRLCSECETTTPSVIKAKAEKDTIVCMQYGFCTYKANSVHVTMIHSEFRTECTELRVFECSDRCVNVVHKLVFHL